jgi:hypothetical protein
MTTSTGDDAPADDRARAVLRTRHDAPAVVANAVAPDHTDQLRTTVEGDYVVTRVGRPDAGGLRATVDDYVVNLRVADAVHDAARGDGDTGSGTARPTDSDSPTHDTDNT